MARGRQTLTQRIAIGGDEQVRDRLNQIGQQGDRAFNQLRRGASRTTQTTERFTQSSQRLGGRMAQLRERIFGARRELEHMNRAEPGMRRLAGTLGRLGGLLATAFAARNLARMTTEWSFLQDRIAAVTDDTIEVTDAMSRLTRIANQVGEDVQTVSRNYADQATILSDLNLSTREQLDLTEAITLALGQSGLHGQEATEAQNQLARAMVRGNLESRQLRRVLERGSRVVQLLSEELNVGATRIREMGEAGEITSELLTRVFLENLDQLRRESAGAAITIGDAFTIMQNNMLEFVGTTDQASGASAALARGILLIANNLDIVIPAIALFGVTWAGVQLVQLIATIVTMTRSLFALAGAMFAANLPLLLLAASIAVIVGGVAHFSGLLDPLYERLGLLREGSEEGREGLEQLSEGMDRSQDSATTLADTVSTGMQRIQSDAREAADETAGAMQESSQRSRSSWLAALRQIGDMFSTLGEESEGILAGVLAMVERVIAAAERAARAVRSVMGGGEGRSQGGGIGFAGGGAVRGKGSATSDSIFAGPRYWLSDGEYIIRAAAVRRYGTAFMDMLNRGRVSLDRMKGFAAGGLVEGMQQPMIGGAAGEIGDAGGVSGRPLSLTIDGETFEGLIAPETVAERLVRFASQKRVRALGDKPNWYGG